jgi:hypothetical protein
MWRQACLRETKGYESERAHNSNKGGISYGIGQWNKIRKATLELFDCKNERERARK